MSDRVILSELNPVQKQVLSQAAQRADMIRQELDRAVGQYRELLAMAMPTGANGFDDKAGIFYYEEPEAPEAPDTAGPELVQDKTEE